MEIWAAAIIFVIARLNFLFDPERAMPLSTDTICDYFDTVKSTVGNKAFPHPEDLRFVLRYGRFLPSGHRRYLYFCGDTRGGFILPKSMADDFEIDMNRGKSKAFVQSKNGSSSYQRPNKLEKNDQSVKKKKPKDDKQLSLFDDK